jgi:DHA3 family macrolide efflux protein-like MFS transporter
MMVIVNGSTFAMLQVIVPAEIQGRVFTIVLNGSGVMAPLGLAVAGPVADALGVRAWFVASGIVMLIMGVGALFVPAIMDIEGEAAPAPFTTAAAVAAASQKEEAERGSASVPATS